MKRVRSPEEIFALAEVLDEMDATPEKACRLIDALVVQDLPAPPPAPPVHRTVKGNPIEWMRRAWGLVPLRPPGGGRD